jgi:uncharacterized repeat protein (TIGR01451 family)
MSSTLQKGGLWLLFCLVLGTPYGARSAYKPKGTKATRATNATAPCANPGKDGNPAALSGVVNTYFPGRSTAASGGSSLSVSAVAGATGTAITPGDLLLVIQMQGADINSTNTTAYGANNASGAGNLTTNFTAGNYEYVVASSSLATGTAGIITTTTPLVNSYSTVAATATTTRRSFQVVRIPQYGNVTLGGTVSALAWNGSIGGVLVMDVAGTLTLAGQTLNAAGTGFRGGAGIKYLGYATGTAGANTDYRTPSTLATSTVGANGTKGEGTAGTPRYTAIGTASRVDNTTNTTAFASGVTDGYPNGDNGRGAPGNAGGGGTDGQSPTANGFNAGGAGGGNGGAGGLGGAPRNNTATPSNGASLALGGVAFAATPSRLVMGGGGGAGSSNDGNGNAANDGLFSSGAPGGGIILVRTGSVSGTGTANASGAGGYLLQGASGGVVTNDATGGGGAGGTVLITARTPASLSGLTALATGGAGSSNANNSDVPHGPGGGGSGGIVLANGALSAATVTGGVAGTTTYNGNLLNTLLPVVPNTSNFAATAGANGTSTTNISLAIDNSVAGADCVADLSSAITATPTVNTGQRVTVQATFSNTGPATASATGTVTLPAGARVSSAPGGTISVNSSTNVTTVTYAIAAIAAGGSVPFTIAYTPNTTGTFTVNSNVTSTTLDLVASNNTASAQTTVGATGAVGTPAACANPGKDGAGTLATNPNTYFPSTASQTLNAGATSISVGAATGATTNIAPGDLLLVIQMQGADINSANSDTYGDGTAGGGASGNLTTNFTAGTYEYVAAASGTSTTLASGGTIALASSLKNSYVNAAATTAAGQRTFQVIRVPQYTSLTLSANITATPWNGSSGGIIVLDVQGATNLAGFTINATGAGFRGGAGRRLTGTTSTAANTDYRVLASLNTGGQKGEGTAGTPQYVNNNGTLLNTTTDGYPSGSTGRGAPGNAGGGGTDGTPASNAQNDGGGGGANGGAGGRGGNTWSSNLASGGEPGAAFPASSSSLVLGGGGGAGSSNDGSGTTALDGFASSGAAGGGIVLLRTGSVTGAGTILANGANASNNVTTDGSGGGGAGGSILVTANSNTSSLTLTANGGTGGTNAPGTNVTAHGPGGGGGGGVILFNSGVAATASTTPGTNGTTTGGSAYGAAAGSTGVANSNISRSIANSVSGANCSFDVATTLTGPATANAGQPTGTFTATFSNNSTGTATSVGQKITLPQGAGLTAAQRAAIVAAYPGTTFTVTGTGITTNTVIDFGTLSILVGGASNSYDFVFTAPTTAGTITTISTTSTTSADTTPNNNTATFNTTISTVADVTVALNGPATLNASQPTGTYTATFTNEGPGTAINVARIVTLPAGSTLTSTQQNTIRLAYQDATFPAAGTINFGALPALASDANSVVTFAFTAPPQPGSSSLMGSTSTANSEGANAAPNTSMLTVTTLAPADVVAAITASTAATVGTFNVTFSNQGSQDAAGVTRTVQLPAGLTGVTLTGDAASYDSNTGLVTYSTSPTTLAVGSSLTSSISYNLTSSANQVAATAAVSTTTNEAGLTANNTATAVMPAQFDLATTLSGPNVTIAGSPTTLYVTTTNNGPNGAPIASQTIIIPSDAQLTNVYITNGGTYSYNTNTKLGTVTFPDVANLPTGQTITNSVSFAAPASNFTPSASVAPTTGDTNTANNTAYLNGSTTGTALAVAGATQTLVNEAVAITANATIVNANAAVIYTVTATNKGALNTTTATNVATRVQLLPGLTTSTLSVEGNTSSVSGNTITFLKGSVATTYNTTTGVLTYPVLASQTSGTTNTYDRLTVQVPTNTGNNGQLLATASVSTSNSDPVPADNTSSVAVTVRVPADLATTITGPTVTSAGQTASYTATFTSRGPGSATNVVETAQLPAGLNNVLVQDASGNVITNAYSATTGLVTLPLIANAPTGTSQTFGISFAAPGQNFVVSSAVSSGTTDNVTTNNSALLSTTVSPTSDVATYVSGPPTAVAGNAISYAVTTINNGPNTASAVQPTLQLPAGLVGPGTNNGVVLSDGATYNATTGVVTFPSANLAPGDSRVGTVTFIMPASPAAGQLSATASVSSSSADLVLNNNTAAITTDIAPATPDQADLSTFISIAGGASSAQAGSQITYNLSFTNNSTTTPAIKVMPMAYLPAGLTNVAVRTPDGTLIPNAYNSTTGQVSLPAIDSQPALNVTSYTISLAAPANTLVISASSVSSNTSDPTPGNNNNSNTLTITPAFDVVTSLAGPTSAQPGSVGTYTVTTTNNGPSTSPSATNTTQTVTVTPGAIVGGLGTNANYNSGTGVITFSPINSQLVGANGAVANTFTVQMPATGSLTLNAVTASAGESNSNNNQAPLITNPTNQAPVALNVWNTLRSARGNTANQQAPNGLLISPLVATDAESTISNGSYLIVALPSTTQGVLYLSNGSPASVNQPLPANGLYFAPAPGFVGNATFTYIAQDNGNATSNQALYTIPVADDQLALYNVYNTGKGGISNPYRTNDVLAQGRDANAATYNSSGVIYDELGVLQTGANNGLASAVLTAGTLPSGVSLNPSTGSIYVSDANQLPRITQATSYTVSVTVTDANGGVSVVPITFTIGANPLPVELTAFTAQAIANRDALLNWTTASELHSAYFDVERSFDGTTFTKIGQLAAQGSKLTPTAYTLTDAGIGTRTQAPVYYRLKQVDVDGSFAYSPVRTLAFTQPASLALSLYPNPARSTTSLELSQLPASSAYQVLMLDATGRQVLATTLAGGAPRLLDVSSLAAGTYNVLVTGTRPDGTPLRQLLRLTKE